MNPETLPRLKLKELITGDSPEQALKLSVLLLRHNDSVLVEHITEGDARARDLILKFQTKSLFNAIDHLYRGFTEMRQHSCLKCCPTHAKETETVIALKEGEWLQKMESRLREFERALAAQNEKQIQALLKISQKCSATEQRQLSLDEVPTSLDRVLTEWTPLLKPVSNYALPQKPARACTEMVIRTGRSPIKRQTLLQSAGMDSVFPGSPLLKLNFT